MYNTLKLCFTWSTLVWWPFSIRGWVWLRIGSVRIQSSDSLDNRQNGYVPKGPNIGVCVWDSRKDTKVPKQEKFEIIKEIFFFLVRKFKFNKQC